MELVIFIVAVTNGTYAVSKQIPEVWKKIHVSNARMEVNSTVGKGVLGTYSIYFNGEICTSGPTKRSPNATESSVFWGTIQAEDYFDFEPHLDPNESNRSAYAESIVRLFNFLCEGVPFRVYTDPISFIEPLTPPYPDDAIW